jgi:PAS domain S-box-containing protein
MTLLSTVVSGIYGLAAFSGVGLGYVTWRNRDRTGAMPLFGVVVAACWWSAALFLASNLEAFAPSMWLQRSTYLAVVVIVAGIFLFALEYTGRGHLVTRSTLGLIAVHPVVVSALVVLNPADVFFATVAPAPAAVTGVALEFGPAFWVHALYSYVLLTLALVVLFRTLYRSGRLYRWQFLLLFVSVVLTAVVNYAYIAGPVSFDAAPVGILVAAGLFTVALTRYRLIDIVPVARDTVLDEINDAVFVVDAEDRLVDVNTAGRAILYRLAGAEADDLVGKDLETLFEAVPALRAVYSELTTAGEGRMEIGLEDSYFDVRATPIEPRGDRRAGWVLLARDVTERKHREEELRRRNEQLDQFASVVSHDLRNPLGVAKGFLDLLETDDETYRAEIEGSLDRMEAIIDDVLTLAREGEGGTDPEPVSVRAVAEAAWSNVDTAACELDVPEDWTVLADRDRLVRVLENLFRNSVAHGTGGGADSDGTTPADGPTTDGAPAGLTVTVERTDGGFAIADDGVGIPEAHRGEVFDSGFSTGERGLGTGLDIVRQLAEAHGWTVSVAESSTGGASFEFEGVERPRE